MKSRNDIGTCHDFNVEELEKKARKLANCTRTTINTGNSVVLFTMLLLEELLEQLSRDPLANLTNILAIAAVIANLNNSIKIDP